MKKIILFAMVVLFGLPCFAQTKFRNLTYEEAIVTAKLENKLVFIDFYTDWCGPCKRMMSDVFPQKSVGDYMNSHFVCIKINAEKEGKELANLYQIKAYPTFIVINADKKIILTKVGMAPADIFINEIDRMLDPDRTPARMKERYENGERTPELISSYASWLLKDAYENDKNQAQKEKAILIINDYFNNLNDEEKTNPINLFIYKDYIQKPTDEIVRFMVKHINEFPKTSQSVINTVLSKLYHDQLYAYLTNSDKYDANTYKLVKTENNELGYNDNGCYDLIYQLIECYAKGNLNEYLDLCEQLYELMSQESRDSLISNMSKLISTKDTNTRQRASKFVRSKLANMEITQMYVTVYDLMLLEGVGH